MGTHLQSLKSNLQKKRALVREAMPPKIQKSKEAKAKAAMSSSKGKKKKWGKGKVRDKLVNLALFDKATFDKFNNDSERMKVRASLAKCALRRLAAEGKIEEVVKHSGQVVYKKLGEVEAPESK